MTHCILTVSGTSVRKYNHLLQLTCMLALSFLVDIHLRLVSTSYLLYLLSIHVQHGASQLET